MEKSNLNNGVICQFRFNHVKMGSINITSGVNINEQTSLSSKSRVRLSSYLYKQSSEYLSETLVVR